MCIDVNDIPYSSLYTLMHAGNASLMVRAGACAHSLPLRSHFLLFLHSHHFDLLLIELNGQQIEMKTPDQDFLGVWSFIWASFK
jgi:hypothetical protein